jgi:glycerol-3-phosphate dehydrogenase (NAD(P)+)
VLEQAAPHVRPWIPVVSLTKGPEERTRLRMTQVFDELLPGHPVGVLSGPNVAKELMDGLAAAAVVAIPDERVAQALQAIFKTRLFRVYTSTDRAPTSRAPRLPGPSRTWSRSPPAWRKGWAPAITRVRS